MDTPDKQTAIPRQTPKLKWAERYNCHRFSLAPGLELGINWSVSRGHSWEVRVFGQRLETDFDNFYEAEAAAINKAKQELTAAMGRLPA